jgi:hypothetical protein
MIKTIKMLVFAAVAVLLVSCSSYPTELITNAKGTVEGLSAVQADIYANDAYTSLNDSLTGALTLAEKQKSKFLFKSYGKVNEQLNGVISYAEVVRTQAIENKAKVKAEVVTVLANVRTLNDENALLLKKAPRGKDERAALIAIESDITLINTEYDSVNGEVETSANLFISLDKAKAIEAKAASINDELKTAIGK